MSFMPGAPYDPTAIFGGGPSWLPQGVRNNPFGQPQASGGISGLMRDPNFALALLANSRGQRFGQSLGNAGLQAVGMQRQAQDDELKRQLMEAQIAKLQQVQPGQDGVGDYQPGDYTPASWAKFVVGGMKDPAVLERFITPRQEYSPSFQQATKINPDGSTVQGVFNTRTGKYEYGGPIVPAGTKSKAEAQGTAEGKIAGDLAAKSGRAYDTFKVGIGQLDAAMNNSATGPFVGRLPAITTEQQIAEGAEANMAPILKNLFRESGEGTFTEGDQALLLRMAPTRKDSADARKAKIEMIDAIVKTKLGIGAPSAAPGTPANPAPAGGAKKKRYNPQTGKIEEY